MFKMITFNDLFVPKIILHKNFVFQLIFHVNILIKVYKILCQYICRQSIALLDEKVEEK